MSGCPTGRLTRSPGSDGPTLKAFVRDLTAEGAMVYTDEATAYRGLPNHAPSSTAPANASTATMGRKEPLAKRPLPTQAETNRMLGLTGSGLMLMQRCRNCLRFAKDHRD